MIDETKQTVTARAGSFHQLDRNSAHRIAWIDLHDGLQSHFCLGRSVNESVDTDRADVIGAAQFTFQQFKDGRIAIVEAHSDVAWFTEQSDDGVGKTLRIIRRSRVGLKLTFAIVD